MKKHNKVVPLVFVGVALIGFSIISFGIWRLVQNNVDTIKVGILHSITGTMASSEQSVVDATLMAIDEINESGGVLGRRIEPIVVDGKSDWSHFALQAEDLVTEKKVEAIFGCWTSASRKEVKPIVEKYNNLLFYPVQYEGAELSPNIIYTGATPNQQLLPGINWCFENLGKRFFIVGSDYIYPRIAGIIARELLHSLGANIVGEEYLLLGSKDVEGVVQQIKKANPDVILNTINGDTNISFFRALRALGVTPEKVPTMSFSIAESELKQFDINLMAGDYAAWNYFQSIGTVTNEQFVARFKKRYGQDRVINDPMEAAYFGVYMWSQAVFLADSSSSQAVLEKIHNQSKKAPEGMVYVDGFNHHTWKVSRVGKINRDGQFDIQWSSKKAVYPIVYIYKSADDWQNILNDLYTQWGGKWARE